MYPSVGRLFVQEIVPIMDLAVNEEFTKMYSEEELLGARRIQVTYPRYTRVLGILCENLLLASRQPRHFKRPLAFNNLSNFYLPSRELPTLSP